MLCCLEWATAFLSPQWLFFGALGMLVFFRYRFGSAIGPLRYYGKTFGALWLYAFASLSAIPLCILNPASADNCAR